MSMPTCSRGKKPFFVIKIGGDAHDTYAARTYKAALAAAQPDPGSHLTIYKVCATDAGAARMPSVYQRAQRSARRVHMK